MNAEYRAAKGVIGERFLSSEEAYERWQAACCAKRPAMAATERHLHVLPDKVVD
jgi:hypothetical protein